MPPSTASHLGETGRNACLLDQADAKIIEAFPKMRSFLVTRSGKLVYEKYYNGHAAESLNDLRSATKSFTSVLIGIASGHGLLPGLDEPLLGLIRHYALQDVDPALQRSLTLRRLLTMTTGLAWQTGKKLGEPFIRRLHRGKRWTAFALSLPVVPDMVGRFQYRSIDTHLLSVILSECTGMDAYAFAKKNLFEPLGIKRSAWLASPENHSMGHVGLFLTSRDLVKFGMCCLQGGRWEDKQVIPASWLSQALRPQVEGYPAFGDYGFGWWCGKMNGQTFSCAHGHGGQQLYLFPEKEAVVVFTADSKVSRWKNPRPLLQEFVLGAVDQPFAQDNPAPVRET
ncbi:serine hydrolase [Paenibacillus sp. VCA1]|uniref:serine hydrolase domain-containing protein n=1 Tax=Paenibacillus sp. VCA1 TaxID=3039148 RepID=UPI002870D718|nr:serine hydrolase [Paenibacillus sp. VCA1]MDR9852450.1 serine hydrolase [Paenibacillus sp. VCA1]